ncbi:MAG: hypothetical protein J6I66_00100 [Lachnospiraceae bacterium]|nr:hypothetical protein [Lachnospiraceae bacterium]
MGFKFINRDKRLRAESADSDFDAFREEDEYYEEPGYDTASIDFEESEEYYEDDYSEEEYEGYEDDRDYFDADEDYDSEYNTASFDTASLETLSHLDYDTASIDYEAVREIADEREYYDEEPETLSEEEYYEEDSDSVEEDEYYEEESELTEEQEYYEDELEPSGAEQDYSENESLRTVEEQEYPEEFVADNSEYSDDYEDYSEDRDYYDEDSESYSADSEYDDYEEILPAKGEHLEDDEYIDLDKSYDQKFEDKRKKGNVVKIIIIAAACILLAAVGVFALKDKIFHRQSTVAEIEYITTPSGVRLPYSEQMVGSGSELTNIEMIGGNGLRLALDARKTNLATPDDTVADTSHDYEETEIITRTNVSIELITVKADLKIRFINNETGKLIPNVAFKVTVTDPSGKALTWSDDDKDGIIYKSSITEGKYTVHVEAIEGDSYQGYTWPADKSVTVKNTIEYAVVDVQGEVKEANQVNETAEDTASRGNTDQQNMTDTTESVASSESTDYSEIVKDTIADPGASAGVDTDVSGNGSTVDMTAQLKDKSGNEVYVFENNAFRKATNADYANFDKFYIVSGTKYTGWQEIGGSTYYYDKDGKPVTGTQVINGVTYQFAADGKLTSASGVLGIDVSKWNGVVDWNAVKAAGVEFVIIRVGYRGSSAGALIDDAMFATNIQGAKAAGLKVGVYFVTQAINDVEAVYEASMVLDRVRGYSLDMPIFLDVEPSGGRGDTIDKTTRTAVITAFCETIRSAGYTAGIYANKTWLNSKMDTSAFGNYVIWVAHYSSVCGYTGRYTCWQYTDKGTLPGINGSVDLNLWYS